MEFFDTLFSEIKEPYKRDLYKIENNQSIVEKWRKKFSMNLHDHTGDWIIGGYDWHIFRYGYATAVEGKDAIERYQKVKMTRGSVFTHAGYKRALGCAAPQLPSYVAIEYALSLFKVLTDVYIAPADFSWTFVVTHENSTGIGPFFAEAEK